MALRDALSADFVTAAAAERDTLAVRLLVVHARVDELESLVAEARDEAESLRASIRAIEELAGIAPQMAFCEISEELRGERLREVALEVLRRLTASGDPVHYRLWFEALVDSGYRVLGRDPLATFLTQVSRMEHVEKIGSRSGLYRLRDAA